MLDYDTCRKYLMYFVCQVIVCTLYIFTLRLSEFMWMFLFTGFYLANTLKELHRAHTHPETHLNYISHSHFLSTPGTWTTALELFRYLAPCSKAACCGRGLLGRHPGTTNRNTVKLKSKKLFFCTTSRLLDSISLTFMRKFSQILFSICHFHEECGPRMLSWHQITQISADSGFVLAFSGSDGWRIRQRAAITAKHRGYPSQFSALSCD